MAHRWLFKTEPSSYSFTQLCRDRRAVWDGVKNPQALKNLDRVQKGDDVFIYHTGDEKAVVGVANAARSAYADPKQKDPKLLVVDLVPIEALRRPVTLAEIKSNPKFVGWDLVRLPRLSVMEVPVELWREIEAMSRK